ncbi:scabin-related ADP-ribosyltransferase [Streptomyces mexicanus]
MLFILTGERLLQADEDLAYDSRQPYARLGKRVRELSGLIESSVRDIAQSMPEDVAREYVRAMNLLIDDGGKNLLRDFGTQLDAIADGRVKTSMDIMEAKWQVIAEVVRLLIEIAFYLAMSFFTGGASLTQIALAKARSRLLVLTTLSHLLERTHLMPSLTEALEEAFTTFAVRLAMMVGAPDGRRPGGFDWKQILQDGLFGLTVGFFDSVFRDIAHGILKGYDKTFYKSPPDLDFKGSSKNGPDVPTNRPDLFHDGGDLPKDGPDTHRSGADAGRGGSDLPGGGHLTAGPPPGAAATTGHHLVKEGGDFLASGGAESLAELLINGSTSWSTFVGAGVSDRVGTALNAGAVNTGNALRDLVTRLRGMDTHVGTGGTTGGHQDASPPPDGGPTAHEVPPTAAQSSGDALPEAVPGHTGQGTGAVEHGLWQQVHTGSPEVREQALDSLAAQRGGQRPTAVETDVRAALHQSLGGVPEVRVLAGGQGPATQADLQHVRDTLSGLGPDVRTQPFPDGAGTETETGQAVVTVGQEPTSLTGADEHPNTGPAFAGAPDTPGPSGSAHGPAPAPRSAPLAPSGAAPVATDGRADGDATAPADAAVNPRVDTATGPAGAADSPAEGGSEHSAPPGASDAAAGAIPTTGTPTPGTLTGGQQNEPAPSGSTGPTGGGSVHGPGLTTAADGPTTGADTPTTTPLPHGAAPTTGTAAVTDTPTGPLPAAGTAGVPDGTAQADTAIAPHAPGGARPGDTTPTGEADPTAGPAGTHTGDGGPQVGATGPQGRPGPLTVILSDGPLPYGDQDAAARLLDASGADRAVVLGPPPPAQGSPSGGAPQTAGRATTGQGGPTNETAPHRQAAVVTREGPDGPVHIRPLPTAPLPGGDAAGPGAFPGADVLVPLAGVLSPETAAHLGLDAPPPRPVTESTATVGTPASPASGATADGGAGDGTSPAAPFPSGGAAPVARDGAVPAPRPSPSPRTTSQQRADHDASAGQAPHTGDPSRAFDDASGPSGKETPVARPVTVSASAPGDPADIPYGSHGAPPGDRTGEGEAPTRPHADIAEPEDPATWRPAPAGAHRAALPAQPGAGHPTRPGAAVGARGDADGEEPAADVRLESATDGPDPVAPSPTTAAPGTVVISPHGVTAAVTGGSRRGRPSLSRLLPRPARSRRSGSSEIRTLDGHTVPVEQIRRLVADTAGAPPRGRAVRTVTVSQSPAEDGSRRSVQRQSLLGQDTHQGLRRAPAVANGFGGSQVTRTVFTGPHRPLPGSGTPEGADYVVAHGTPRTVTLGTNRTDMPSVVVSGPQLGEVLRHWGIGGGRRRPIVLFACETGLPPKIAGLPVAQHVANRTGKAVYAPTTAAGTARDSRGEVRAVLLDGPDGPGEWRLFTPEPSGRKLDALARAAGLHRGRGPADAFVRAHTLQQVRTLRGTLGPDAEQRGDHRELLRALAFVDGLRWRTPDPAGRYTDARMTPDLLTRMVADRYGLTDGTAPSTAQYTGFLREAAALRAAGPEASLRTLLPPPLPELPPDTLVRPDDVRGLEYSASARITWQLSDAPLPLSELRLSPEDTATLISRRPDLLPGGVSSAAVGSDRASGSGAGPGPEPDALSDADSAHSLDLTSGTGAPVRAEGREFRLVPTGGDGDCFFTSVLTGARGQNALPQWAAMDVAGLRRLLHDRLHGSELADALTESSPDPVRTVLDDLRSAYVGPGPVHPDADAEWRRFSDAVLSGDTASWRRLVEASPYPDLLTVAPTPEEARRLGAGGLLTATAHRSGLWASPFGDLIPVALAQATGIDLRVVGNDGVLAPNPTGSGGTVYVRYNGRDHYDALVPVASAPAPSPAPAAPDTDTDTVPATRQAAPASEPTPAGKEPVPAAPAPMLHFQELQAEVDRLGEVLAEEPTAAARLAAGTDSTRPLSPGDIRVVEQDARVRQAEQRLDQALSPSGSAAAGSVAISSAGATAAGSAAGQQTTDGDGDRSARVPLETQLERQRPPRLLTGAAAPPPGPPPREVTFDDGSRLPAALIAPDGAENGRGSSGALMPGVGRVALRDADKVADHIVTHLPPQVRSVFDDAELRRLLTEDPSAFTAPRGARFVARQASGVGYEVTVQALPYHRWERFADPEGGTVKLDSLHRGQGTTTAARTVSSVRRIAGAVSLGPPLEWMLRLAASFGRSRRTDYNSGMQAFSQSEWRAMDGSHLHLDDVHYQVRVERVTAPTGSPGSRGGTGTPATHWRRTPVHHDSFAVRDGLSWRLPDTITEPGTGPRLAPQELTFPDGVMPRITDTEGLHLTDPPEELALAMSGARPGSSAHRTLVSFLRPTGLLALFPRLTGQVVGPELTRGHTQRPLGHLIVERSVAHRGTLVTEATKVELRDMVQIVQQNERTHSRDTRFGAEVSAGPNHTFYGTSVPLRLQGGPIGQIGLATGRAHYIGGSAARKFTGRIKGTPVGLYRVERTLYLRKPGEPARDARPFRVTTLDWLPTTEARRLAGWDARTPGQSARGVTPEPPAPPYLTVDDPTHLGQTRAESFLPDPSRPHLAAPPGDATGAAPRPVSTPSAPPPAGEGARPASPSTGANAPEAGSGHPASDAGTAAPSAAPAGTDSAEGADGAGGTGGTDGTANSHDPLGDFTDAVIDTLHDSFPGMFPSAWERRHPKLARLLHGDGRTRVTLHNDRQVREALNRPTLAQSLEVLTTTGVPVALTENGTLRRGHHTLVLTARLTDRRYETSLSERSLRNSVTATQQVGQGQQDSSTQAAGIEVGVSPRDAGTVPETGWARRIGWLRAGYRRTWQRQQGTRNTISVANDHLTAQSAAHLFSYKVELNASVEGYRRPRGWARFASVGILGTGYFVSTVRSRPLFDGTGAPVGRVELAVPAAHSSERYPSKDPAPLSRITGTPPAPTDTGTPSPLPHAADPDDAPAPHAVETAPGPQAPAARVPRTTAPTDQDGAPPGTAHPPVPDDRVHEFLDGTWSPPVSTDPEQSRIRDLLSRPFAVLSAEGARQRHQAMAEAAGQATGESWHVSAPGTPVRNALRRASENLTVAGHLGQILSPFGLRTTGLDAKGSFRTHHIKAALHGRLHRLRVTGDPNNASFEVTTGAARNTVGSSGSSTTDTFGLQNSLSLQQLDGHGPVHGGYAAGGHLTRTRGSSSSRTVSNGRNTILTYSGRTYPVVGDLTETVAVRDRWSAALGLAGTRAASTVRQWAGHVSTWAATHLAPRPRPDASRTHDVPEAVILHVPMQDAIETGLAPDGLGATTPHHLAGGYRIPPFLQRRRFTGHPTGQLDASGVAGKLMPHLERLGVPSHDREDVLRLMSPDFLRGQLLDLTTDGVAVPIRYRVWSRPGDLPTGGSPAQVRFRLRPVTTTVDRLRNGYEVEDYRPTGVDQESGSSRGSGGDAALAVSESPAVDRDTGLLGAGPTVQGIAGGSSQSSKGRVSGTAVNPNIATTQSHAELVTHYSLTVEVVDGTGEPLLKAPVEGEVGVLRELLPVSLLTPHDGTQDPATVDAADTLPGPDRTVKVLTPAEARPEAVARWREGGDLSLDDAVGTGFLAVDMIGAPSVGDALTLATAQADGAGDAHAGSSLDGDALDAAVRRARRTPLTVLGTAAAQAQQQATGPTGLTAALRDALSADGRTLPRASSAQLFGQSHTADAKLYARMSRSGARLLAVENKPRMEGAVRGKESDTHDAGRSTTTEITAGTSPMAGTGGAGVITPGAAGPLGGTTEGANLKGGAEAGLGTHRKIATTRSLLFALPVRWLSVVEAHQRITDSRAARALRHPHTFGRAQRGPRAAEAQTTALVWVREDIATDLGLIDDTTFPEEVRTAWDRMAEAQADMAKAEKEYYDARARARTAWLSMTEEERAAVAGDRGAAPPAAGTAGERQESAAVAAWRAARADARLWEDRTVQAAEATHRLHAAAESLTARRFSRTGTTAAGTATAPEPPATAATAAPPATGTAVPVTGAVAQAGADPAGEHTGTSTGRAPDAARGATAPGAGEVPANARRDTDALAKSDADTTAENDPDGTAKKDADTTAKGDAEPGTKADADPGRKTGPADGTASKGATAYAKPDWWEAPVKRFRVEGGGDKGPLTIAPPGDGGPALTVHPVPHDGASFFHALIAAAEQQGRLLPLLDTATADGAGVSSPADLVESARRRLVDALGERGNEDLLDALALGRGDSFTQEELTTAGLDLDEAHRQEFTGRGALPEQRWLTAGERLKLATGALRRPLGTPEHLDHGAADLLPVLAARVLRTPVTVVTKDGYHQRFLPVGADGAAAAGSPGPELTLYHDGTYFHVALPSGAPAPSFTTPTPPPGSGGTDTGRTGTDKTSTDKAGTNTTGADGTSTHKAGTDKTGAKRTGADPGQGTPARDDGPRRPSHTTPPWAPSGRGDRFRAGRDGTFTGPDGTVYVQGPVTGRGNGFFDALAHTMRHAAASPGVPRAEAGRLRARSTTSPNQLMRRFGLPGRPEERDGLFHPPPPRLLTGRTLPGTEDERRAVREIALRNHLAAGLWDAAADRVMAAWAARATGATVTLVEENGTAHTYPGASKSTVKLVLRRRGRDVLPLLPVPSPATVPVKPEAGDATTHTGNGSPAATASAASGPRTDRPAAPTAPPPGAPSRTPPAPRASASPASSSTGPAGRVPEPVSSGGSVPGEEDAHELDTLSGDTAYGPSWRQTEWESLTSGEFPVLHQGDGWTVWGVLDTDPAFTALAAENRALGLRGLFHAHKLAAGGITDASGRLYTQGPGWDWYHPTRGLVASSRLRTGTQPGQRDDPLPLPWNDAPTTPSPTVPPRTTAAHEAPSPEDLPHPVRWRDDDEPLYRFTAAPPQEVFPTGLRAPGRALPSVLDHVRNGAHRDSVYLSTTRDAAYVERSLRMSPRGAAAMDARYRWRYDLDVPGGIDVNATLGFASPYPDQREVLLPGGVAPHFVRGAQRMLDGRPFGPYTPNPGYRPPDTRPLGGRRGPVRGGHGTGSDRASYAPAPHATIDPAGHGPVLGGHRGPLRAAGAEGQVSGTDANSAPRDVALAPPGASEAADPVRDWVRISAVSGQRRSGALRAIDDAVARLPRDPRPRDLRAVLNAVRAWQQDKDEHSSRWAAVARLENAVLGLLAEREARPVDGADRPARPVGPAPSPVAPAAPRPPGVEGFAPASGFEAELHQFRVVLPAGDNHEEYGDLVELPGLLTLTLDAVGGVPVLELVTAPARGLEGGRDDGRAERAEVLAAFRDVLERLHSAPEGATLSRIFPARAGYRVDPLAEDLPVRTHEAGHGIMLVHHTATTPLSGVVPFLAHVADRMRRDAVPIQMARVDLGAAAQYAARGREQFLRWLEQDPRGAADLRPSDADELEGALALGYTQVAAAARGGLFGGALPKDYSGVTSRESLAAVRAALGPVPRAFLESRAEQLARDFADTFRTHVPGPVSDPLGVPLWQGRSSGARTGHYLDNLLHARPERVVDQHEGLAVRTNYDALDTNTAHGTPRIDPPVTRLEVRSYASARSTPDSVERDYDTLARFSLELYNRARQQHGLRPVGGPVVQGYAPPAGDAGTHVPEPPGAAPTHAARASGTDPAPGSTASPRLASLVARLPGMGSSERAAALALLTEAERDALAADAPVVRALRDGLSPEDFAAVAAPLLVRVPAGVHRPVSARQRAEAHLVRMLGDPETTERLLTGGARLIVVPRDTAMTSLEAFRHLKGAQDGRRRLDTERGVFTGGSTATTEENLLGETTTVPGGTTHPDGYSTTTHEFAHAIHLQGLGEADRRWIADVYRSKIDQGEAAHWPDGPLHAPASASTEDSGTTAGRTQDARRGTNYSSRNDREYFAQLSNAYLGTNTGTDPFTGQPRNNGADWVRRHDPALLPLLERLYGTDPRPAPANPLATTRAENETWEAFRALWDRAEGTLRPQPHPPAPS